MRQLSLPGQLLTMQPPLQSPTQLAGRIDRLGLYLFTFLCCFGWFYYLMGHALPALAAGIALSVLILRTIQLGEKRTLARREATLRRRIGGEMAVDSLLLQPTASAASNVAAWLSQAIELTDFQPKAHGLLAQHETGLVWIACLQKHASSSAGCDDVLAAVRNARREGADVCIVCATSGFSQDAALMAEDLMPRTRLLGRDGLIGMAGVSAPATDEQLRTLGTRRRQKFRRELITARILNPAKKRRYLLYGLGLSLLYLLTGQVLYAIPGIVCLLLFALCRRKKTAKFTI